MKKILPILIGLLVASPVLALTTFQVFQGGTGASTLTGCLTGNGTSAITGSGVCSTFTWPFTKQNSGSQATSTVMEFIGGFMSDASSTLTYASSTELQSSSNAYFATGGGNVGVGTVSPIEEMQVTSAAPTIAIGDKVQTGISPALKFYTGSTPYGWMLSANNNTSGFEITRSVQTGSAGGFSSANTFLTILTTGLTGIGTTTPPAELTVNDPVGKDSFLVGSSTPKLIVKDSGFVGINTGTPTALLNIYKEGDGSATEMPLLNLQHNGNDNYQFVGQDASNYLALKSTNATNIMTWTRSGLVGIGTTTPPALLTLNDPTGKDSFYIGSSTPKLIVKDSGKVGINTASPSAMLDVRAASGITPIDYHQADGVSYGLRLFNDTYNAGTPAGVVFVSNAGTFFAGTNGNTPFTMGTNGATAITIDTSKNVAIGTSTAAHQLTIASSTGPQLTLTDGVSGSKPINFRQIGSTLYLTTSSQTSYATSSTPLLTVDATNNFLGVGVAAPIAAIDSIGNVCDRTNGPCLLSVNSHARVRPWTNGGDMDLTDFSGNGIYIKNGGTIGIGTTTPFALFDISNASSTAGTVQSTPFAHLIEMTIDGVWYMVDSFDYYGHLITGGPTPALSSCGTSPSVVGNDRNMRVTEGTSSGTSCTITFAKPYAATPICMITQETGTAVTFKVAPTPGTAVVTGGGTLSSDVFSLHCEGIR